MAQPTIKNEQYIFTTEDQNIFFTSDTHFGHDNIRRFCHRPFGTVEDMDWTLIDNWNSTVGENDIVFHLGDFGFGSPGYLQRVREQLNGRIYLITGNHDRKNMRDSVRTMFEKVTPQMYIRVNGQNIYLNHLPFLCFDGTYRDKNNLTWQLYGHVHSGEGQTGLDLERLKILFPTQYDVGVDNNGYTPVSFEQVKTIIEQQREER